MACLHARKRGATPIAEVVGYALTADAFHISAPEPTGRGQARAMTQALRNAGVAPDEVDLAGHEGVDAVVGEDGVEIGLRVAKRGVGVELRAERGEARLGPVEDRGERGAVLVGQRLGVADAGPAIGMAGTIIGLIRMFTEIGRASCRERV